MQKKGRLELTWVGKYDESSVEPRILLEDREKSYGDTANENMLIHGDNLIALKALQHDYLGKIKCVYIDPPYNTGYAFDQYDDSLEHSIWLSLMKARLNIIYSLLDDEQGSIWITIDDDEQAYLKVLCDEIFGRGNFVANVIWQKKGSRSNDAKWFSDNHDFIMVYAKDKQKWKINKIARGEGIPKGYSNPDNDPRGPWTSTIMSAKSGSASLLYEITVPSGKKVLPPTGRYWSCSQETFEKWKSDNRIWFGKKGDSAPRKKTFLSEVSDGLVPLTVWLRDEVGDNQEARHEVKALIPEDPFATPKPERLIERILSLGSNPGDLILDSFLGSGTTAAVAQKMGRKWIGIEMGDHAYTHCKKRIDKVIDGDQGGISKDVNWQGGGGYHFYELAPSLLVKNDKLPVYQINPSYTFEMLCEAICKIEGFRYKPQDLFHGHSSEKRFIHITTEFINAGYIKSLSARLAEGQSLLIYGTKIQSDMILPDNIEVKKIPKDLLDKCDFESEVQ